MGKFDSLKKTLGSAAEKAKDVAKSTTEKLRDVDFKEVIDKTSSSIKNTASNLQDSIKNFDADKAKESVSEM